MAQLTIEDEPSRMSRAWRRTRTSVRGGMRRLSTQLTIDRVLSVLAVLLLPMGAVAVALGWAGASRTPFLFEQIPYLISGGLFGVGLLTAGGLLYLGSWVARGAQQDHERTEQLQRTLQELRDELHAARTSAAAQAATAVPQATAQPVDASEQTAEVPVVRPFVATPSGTMFHRPECRVVAGRQADQLRRVAGDEREMQPCGMCAPLSDQS